MDDIRDDEELKDPNIDSLEDLAEKELEGDDPEGDFDDKEDDEVEEDEEDEEDVDYEGDE